MSVTRLHNLSILFEFHFSMFCLHAVKVCHPDRHSCRNDSRLTLTKSNEKLEVGCGRSSTVIF